MGLDINKVKSRLAQMQSKGKKNADGSFEKIDFKKVYWKPKLGKQVIRLVPSKTNPAEPCLEVAFHNNIVKKKMLALSNWGEKDPIIAFSDVLKKSDDKGERDMGYKLSPKKKYIFQVVVRGEEHLGTRLWEASKTVAEAIYGIIADDDYGDVLDVNDGRDLTIEGIEDSFNNIKYIKVSILPKPKATPLAKTEDEINGFLSNQYDPLSLTKKYSYQELKDFLEQALNPDGAESGETDVEETEEKSEEIPSDELPFVESSTEEESGEEEETETEEPPFEVEITPSKSAIAQASKRIIAKNNAEIKEKVVVKTTETKVKKAATKTAAPAVTGGTPVSNKDKFAALFPKK